MANEPLNPYSKEEKNSVQESLRVYTDCPKFSSKTNLIAQELVAIDAADDLESTQVMVTAFDGALRLAAEGDLDGARREAEAALLESTEANEEGSSAHARALNKYGLVMAQLGALQPASDAFLHASESSAIDDEERLEIRLNLGRAKSALGEHTEAVRILFGNCVLRRERFGMDDPQHAVGLETLAEAQFKQGAFARALDSVGEAADIYLAHSHPRLATALALEAELLVAAQSQTPPFAAIDDLSQKVIEDIATATIHRIRSATAERALALLEVLRGMLMERLGESHGATIRVLAGIANTERELGNNAGRRRALTALAASFECLGAVPQVIETLLQRALAEHENEDEQEADKTHQEALARADELSDARLRAKVLRFCGLHRFDVGRPQDAVETLFEALRQAEQSRDSEQTARCEAALGVVLYLAEVEGAKVHLDRALITLAPDDPDVDWVYTFARRLEGVGLERSEDEPSLLRAAHERIRKIG